MTPPRRVLVVEDGSEYVDGFERLTAARSLDTVFSRARDLEAARAALTTERPGAVFLDVVFDRIPETSLAGDTESLVARFGGDRARAVRHLATHQGFYILDALAPMLKGVPVILAYDFAAEPQRLEVLRKRVPRLSGLQDGASISQALEMMLANS